jgi:methionyl-tRNA formyltransferase
MKRIIFMGTPELARVTLRALLNDPRLEVVAAVTQPDRPKGRDLKVQFSPVKELALEHKLAALQPERAREPNFIESLRGFAPELIVVAAFGQILPQAILDLPPYGCINVHTSLLPKYRGAGPIQWAIINGEQETGVTIMKMDAGMDTGPILTQTKTPITPEDNAQTLHDRLAELGAELLIQTIPDYIAGKIEPRPQAIEGVSYAPKIKKQDGLIDWAQPAVAICNKVRGLVPWPGAFTHLPGEPAHLLKIWKAEVTDDSGSPGAILRADKSGIIVGCGAGALRITEVQREGGKRLPARDFLAGHQLSIGWILGASLS